MDGNGYMVVTNTDGCNSAWFMGEFDACMLYIYENAMFNAFIVEF